MDTDAGVVDAEVVPDDDDDGPAPQALAHRPPVRNEVIAALDPQEVRGAMVKHQELLRQILDESDWQGAPDARGSFVKKSGWRKIALAYNLTLGRVHEEVERDDDGVPQRASYTASATAPNGRTVEATGHCSFQESRFSGARGNTSKLENDMRATAETRAKNRAISDLIGMGKVSAEEVDAGAPAGPPYGVPADEQSVAKVPQALAMLLDHGDGPNDAAAAAVQEALVKDAGGYLPRIVARALFHVAARLKQDLDVAAADNAAAADAAAADTTEGSDG
jgi:hypothetical protein